MDTALHVSRFSVVGATVSRYLCGLVPTLRFTTLIRCAGTIVCFRFTKTCTARRILSLAQPIHACLSGSLPFLFPLLCKHIHNLSSCYIASALYIDNHSFDIGIRSCRPFGFRPFSAPPKLNELMSVTASYAYCSPTVQLAMKLVWVWESTESSGKYNFYIFAFKNWRWTKTLEKSSHATAAFVFGFDCLLWLSWRTLIISRKLLTKLNFPLYWQNKSSRPASFGKFEHAKYVQTLNVWVNFTKHNILTAKHSYVFPLNSFLILLCESLQ